MEIKDKFNMLLILLFVIGAIVTMVVRRLKVAASVPRKRAAIDAQTVRCAHCQVYLPSQDAVSRNGLHYCSTAHAEQARPRP